MRCFLLTILTLAVSGAAAPAAYEEEGLSEAVISTDTVKTGDEDEAQPLIQESDEDLAAFVMDYIRRDTQLKGAFLLEDKADKKILKLTLVSLDQKAKDGPGTAKTVGAVFRDDAAKKFTAAFHLQIGPWGGLDIFKIELKKTAPAKKPGK